MNEENKNLKTNFKGHSKNRNEGRSHQDTFEKHYVHFGVEQGNKLVRRFKLILRSGKQISIPYAHLPVFILEHDGLVLIKTNELSVSIKGRGLKALEEYLSQESIRWVKESTSKRDARESDDFIEEIILDGDMNL